MVALNRVGGIAPITSLFKKLVEVGAVPVSLSRRTVVSICRQFRFTYFSDFDYAAALPPALNSVEEDLRDIIIWVSSDLLLPLLLWTQS